MLELERQAAQQDAFAVQATITQQEMQLLSDNINNMATQAALLLGVVFSFLSADIYDSDSGHLHGGVEAVYYVFTVIAMLALLLVIGLATIVTVMGPTLALTGRNFDAMRTAIESMRADQHLITWVLFFGVVCSFVPLVVLLWSYSFDPPYLTNAICSAIVLGGLVIGLFMMNKVAARYKISDASEPKIRWTQTFAQSMQNVELTSSTVHKLPADIVPHANMKPSNAERATVKEVSGKQFLRMLDNMPVVECDGGNVNRQDAVIQ